MSDESALRNALGAYPEKQGQGDNAALKSALNDLKYTVRQSVYNTPYPNTPAPSAPKPTTPPTQPTTTPTQTAGAVQLPASVSGAPQVTYAPNVTPPQAEPQDFFQSLESKTDAGIDTVAGLLGTDTSNPFARVGGFLLGAGQQVLGAAGDIAGTVGQGINAADEAAIRAQQAIRGEGYDAPLPSNYIKPTDAFANLAGAYNEGLQQPIAGIGGKVMGALGETLFPAYKNKDADTARLTAPTPDVQQTINDTFAAIGRGDIAGALGNVLASLQQYGNQQYEEIEKVDPLGALAASLVLDPLNFVPGMGVGKAQQAGKLAEITRDVGRIENVAELLPKGVMGRIMTPAAKVTETVKSALQNIGLRTQYADNAEELFGNYRRFMKAGEDAKGFAKVVEEMAGMASVPAQRAQRLVQGMGKEVDTIEQAYRTMETALRGADELTDVSKLPKTFQNFIKDVRAGTASADDALDVLKAEMATRTSKYFAEQGAKLFPVKGMAAPVKVAERFMNELRGFESLVYIGLSPFTFVRNVINGVSTMAIEGLNPLWDASREIERLTKMGQVGRAKELERAIKFQETLMKTGRNVREAMGLGTYGTGATGYFGNFMSNMIHGTPIGKPLQWYQRMENAMRARVWSQTYYRALQHNWDVGKFIPEMDAVTQAVLHQYRVDPQKIMGIVREAGVNDKKAVATEVLKYLRGERGGALDIERLAGEMGLSKQQLLAFLDEHDLAKAQSMAQEIAAQVANGKHPAQAVNDVVGQAARETTEEVIARTGAQAPEAVNDVVGQAARETTEEVIARTGAQAPEAAQTGMSVQELEQRRGELFTQWAEASRRGNAKSQKLADDLMAQIQEIESELEQQVASKGFTPPRFVEEQAAQAAQEAGTIVLPEQLRGTMYADEWAQMTDAQREFVIGLERAKQTPMQVEPMEVLPQVADTYQAAGDVPTLMPDVTTGIPAPKEPPLTLGDVAKAAQGKGIATATAEGKPLNKHLLNVLNKHAAENGVERFASMADVQARAEDALKILDSYAPSNAPASVQKAVDEMKRLVIPPQTTSGAVDNSLGMLRVPPKDVAPRRIADQIPAGEILTPDETARRANAIYEEINAQREIDRLRQVATEDPQAVSILSRDEMLKAKARTQADMYEALMRVYQSEDAARVRVGTDAENRVMAWLRRDVFNGMDESRAAAQVTADWMDNAVMISRDGETHFDSALNWLSPFQFWGTRYALQSMRRVADKPARLMWYLKLRDMQDQVENDPRFPKRLRGMMTLPFPGAPKWAGSMWFDPLETFTQIESVFKMNQFDNALTDSDVAGAIRALVESGRVSPSEAANAIANKSGALWDATKAQMEEATKQQEGLDSITTAFKPHMPFDIIWKLRTGNAADIGVLFPMTRLIRNTASLAPQGSFLNPTGTGINIEQPIKAGLRALTGNQSIPDWDQWEQYRVDRALADMVGDGTISERDALIAMIERKGGWYDEAQRRAQEQMRTQNFTSVFGGQMFPQGEQEYYKARVLKDQLINQAVAQLGGNPNDLSYGEKMELIRANGLNKKGTPLGDFYDQNPVYNARGDAYAEPEERLKGFLTDEVWQKYLALSALDKRMARQGNKDLAAFITNPERDYKAVTLEKAAEWVKYLRGYLPEAEQTPKVGALNQIQFAPPDLSAAYQTMQDEQKALFNLDAMQPRMDARAKMTPNEKRAFDAANPDVAAYYKWYGQKMKENPALAKLIHPDTQNNYAANYNQQATNNYLTDQIVKNLNRMVSKLDDSRARRFNPNGRQNKPRPLSQGAIQALAQKRVNPNYYLPRDVYRELIAAFKASGVRMAFEQWLQMVAMQGGV